MTPAAPREQAEWSRGDWMQTFTGRRFYPLDPRADEIDPADIAHALSLLCRYELARLPDPDKLIAFTANRRLIESIGELIESGGPADHQRLVRAIVERVVVADGDVQEVVLSPAILEAVSLERPRTASGTRQPEAWIWGGRDTTPGGRG